MIKILSHKHDTGTVYYASNLELKPGERHIFSTSDSQSFSLQNQTCLTCNQTERKCLFNDAIFSPKADFYILHCMGPDIPWTEIKTVKENNISPFFKYKNESITQSFVFLFNFISTLKY